MTKEIHQYQSSEKEYIATLKLGATTPSFDSETTENYFYATKHINSELIDKVKPNFIGEIKQYPPIFSAIKVDGKKLYENARKGKQIQIKPRNVRITEMEIKDINLPYINLRISCTKGTYIRSLAYDFGKALNSGAWLYKLERTRIGSNLLKNAISIQDFENMMKYY